MYNRVFKYLAANAILYKKWFGFREGQSTEHAIVQLIDKLKTVFRKSIYSWCLYWPFKSIWQCWYHILIKQLNKYEIKGSNVPWFKRDFHNCKNYTTFNTKCTAYETITCSIPQRFILGPLLFLIYVDDLPNLSKLLDPIMFSDDTNLFFRITISELFLIQSTMSWQKLDSVS